MFNHNYLIRKNFGAEKIWHNWCKMAKIAKFNFFLAAPNQIHGEKTFFLIKKSKFVFTLLIFLTEFLVCRTKQRFLSMFMIMLSLEKKVKKTQIKYFKGRNFRNFRNFCPFLRKFLPSNIVKQKIGKVFSSENKNFS